MVVVDDGDKRVPVNTRPIEQARAEDRYRRPLPTPANNLFWNGRSALPGIGESAWALRCLLVAPTPPCPTRFFGLQPPRTSMRTGYREPVHGSWLHSTKANKRCGMLRLGCHDQRRITQEEALPLVEAWCPRQGSKRLRNKHAKPYLGFLVVLAPNALPRAVRLLLPCIQAAPLATFPHTTTTIHTLARLAFPLFFN